MRAVIERLRRDPGLVAVVLALAAVTLLYAPTLGRGLVEYDDAFLIRDNWIVQQASWSSLHTIFFDLGSPDRYTLSPEYLPVRDLSIMLDVALWGDWYPGFHLTNLAIYLVAIVVWFEALVGFGVERWIAGLAIVVWALHPTHAESVAWLAERKGLLGTLFAGLAALGYARFRAGGRGPWLALAMVASIAAVWSKAHAAFAIAALAGLELALPARRASSRRAWAGLAAIAVVGAAAFVPVLYLATSSSVVGSEVRLPTGRLGLVLGVHGFYLQLAAMVIPNSLSYPLSNEGPSAAAIAIGAVGVLVALAVVLAPRGHRWSPSDPLKAAMVLWLICWLPVSHLILPLQMIFVADRYVLLPSLGLALAFAAGASRIASPRGRRALIGVVLFASALRTFDAQSNWRDASTLWERAVQTNPRDGDAWSAYAEAAVRAGDPARAAEIASQGLRLTRSPRLLLRKALVLLENGNRPAGAQAMHEAAVAGEPRAMSNHALMLLEQGLVEQALGWARDGARAMPMYAPANRALGRVALAANQRDEAVAAFTRAYELEPYRATNRYNLGLALRAVGRDAEARAHFEACLADPLLGSRARAALGDAGD